MYEFYNDVAQAQQAPEGRLFEMKNEKEYEYSSSYMVQARSIIITIHVLK